MLTIFHNNSYSTNDCLEDFNSFPDLSEEMEKTRVALEVAYAGFNYAVDEDVIDCYIYEINSLLKRYNHLDNLKKTEL